MPDPLLRSEAVPPAAIDGLYQCLAEAGIVVPPFGSVPRAGLTAYRDWTWGTRDVPPREMYLFNMDLIARLLCDDGPFFALSHDGHGANSYGLSLVTAQGPLAAFVQHHYIGFYSDPVRDLLAVNATFTRLHLLWRAGQDQGGLPLRWLLVCSGLRGPGDIVDLGLVRAGARARDAMIFANDESIDSESALFRAAEKLAGWEGNLRGQPVSW